ncbi:hypothetical protein BJ322DRAFT_1094846 [Thelephora terrestris]|uniref:C2H2-type domain-containing protein n=1 Tax=Thelephora terrestris TaxID=56493 RepID=A0A9P6H249_9AGAM|nr:hypothetical protein BJ322DRAFT_1094846 [Thelephora terrestris]
MMHVHELPITRTHFMSLTTTTVLGKRKSRATSEALLLQLSASESNNEYSDVSWQGPESDAEFSRAPLNSGRKSGFVLVNGSLVKNAKKKYHCTFSGCGKSYSKPCRLEEHERSHTGERPFVCTTCNKTYLRETHLQAHSRSHLPDSDRPLECPEEDCSKRFWTVQHLKVHESTHKGEKSWKCSEADCLQSFAKHHHLREHVSAVHSFTGTKSYRCERLDCSKSFATNQKLRAHQKTHDEKRYSCSHQSCVSLPILPFFSTWTKLQAHMRVVHPPMCPYPECHGKTFNQQKGLKAHLKIHEGRDLDSRLGSEEGATNDDEPSMKRKRGGDHGRDWVCDFEGCTRDFKSKKALTTHHNISHLHKRDFTCSHEGCNKSYGYKHLLQRHLSRAHQEIGSDAASDPEEDNANGVRMDIDGITGRSYLERNSGIKKPVCCPYPNLPPQFASGRNSDLSVSVAPCEHVFGRAYDLRRHLLSEHGLVIEKGVVDAWVEGLRKSMIHLARCDA